MSGDGEDVLFQFITKRLLGWKENLGQFKPLADTGDYPGLSEIKDGLKLIEQLLFVSESYEFIKGFNSRKNDLLDLSDNVHDLEHFYYKQKPTWENLRVAYKGFQLNQSALQSDSVASAALKRMDTILNSAAPYNMVKESEALIQKVEAVNNAEIEKSRKHAFERVDGRIEDIKKDLDLINADSKLSNTCLFKLQSIRKSIETETSIAHILLAQESSIDAFDKAMLAIEAAAKVKPPEPDDDDEETDGKEDKPKPVFKKRCVIEASQLVSKQYLETEQDVDDFLGTLSQKLKQAISNNERVKIK
jgi:hypothetical protein